MDSISKADKEAQYNFLSDQLFPFILDENTPQGCSYMQANEAIALTKYLD